ncbi:hypothetical protein KSP40_PGU002058 [Platanthera guangdongensis]|uniref:Glycoside hydrolase family 38 N-terminal domain-containing protein n=1 Tax=Platanthera guangdongensis TaxID=2320717 RepID=A0ABR2MVQ0_9ASPA
MHDEAAPRYIDMIDQTTLGHLFIKKVFGQTRRIGRQIDPFGHSAVQAYRLSAGVSDHQYNNRESLVFGTCKLKSVFRLEISMTLFSVVRPGAPSCGFFSIFQLEQKFFFHQRIIYSILSHVMVFEIPYFIM